jgi:hypothetical protein
MNKYNYLPRTPLGPPMEGTSDSTSPVHREPDQRSATPAEPTTATAPLERPPAEGAAFPHPPMEDPHERKCSVCRHPNRDAIEEAFLHWQSPNEIATEYDLPGPAPLYRHAQATGLYARRKRNLRFVLENLLERVSEVQVVTPGSIVRAVRAYSRITDDGEWIDPPREIIVTHIHGGPPEDEDHAGASEPPVPHAPRLTMQPQASLPQAIEGSLAALPPPPQLIELQATEFTGHVAAEAESTREEPDKLNANRKSGLLANVVNH